MERTFDVQGPVDLDVRLAAGEIAVDPTADGRVEVVLTAGDDESQRLIDMARVELRESGGRQQVVVDVPNRSGGFGLSMLFGRSGIDCRIRCPEGSALNARTKSAGVRTAGRLGAAHVATASGDVEMRDVDRDLIVKTASGDVNAGVVGGRASVATASGDVSIERARGAVEVATASGDFHVGVAEGDARGTSASGDGSLGSVEAGRISVNSASGDVEIGVRRGSRAHLDCSTVSGDATSELESTPDAAEGDGPLVEIHARTVSGDIRIARAQEVYA